LDHVGDIRQRGFMVGIELVKDKTTREPYQLESRIGHRVALEARRRGLWIRPLGNVIVLMPPLSTTLAELSRMVSILRDAIRVVDGGPIVMPSGLNRRKKIRPDTPVRT
jgi:adenosylmethionine-8-amino-7-oxononanoate aminotransferase